MKDLREIQERRKKEGGFTLVELLIVIAIIAILASIAIPQYLKYQQKAKVSSYAEPVARGCLMDLVSACIEDPANYPPSTAPKNCATPQSTPGGNATRQTYTTGSCSNGVLSSAIIEYDVENVDNYRARCETDSNGNIQCRVVEIN